jgi:TusA-related sulfurtransferase
MKGERMGIFSRFFSSSDNDGYKTILSKTTVDENGLVTIDVRGQTCPGYLLSINLAVEKLQTGTGARLLITYPPCGDDIKAWAKEKNVTFLDLQQQEDMWIVHIRK